MLFWILLAFYLVLVTIQWLRGRASPDIGRWNNIPRRETFAKTAYQGCDRDGDCASNELCFRGECLPKWRGDDTRCNPHTGDWVMVDGPAGRHVKCICKHPHLVTQNYTGGNCDVDVTCGPNGRLESLEVDPTSGRCICDFGYEAVEGPTCRKKTSNEMFSQVGPCGWDEMTIAEARLVFDTHYLNRPEFRGRVCFRRPCSFDSLTGKPLRYAHHEESNGCVCDPRRGNFGVRLDHEHYLRNSPGYDACASIFRREPDREVPVELRAYFYMFDRAPVAFLHFHDLEMDALADSFRPLGQTGSLQIEEEWPYDYMQFAFRNHLLTVHSRSCYYQKWSWLEKCNERDYIDNHMIDCGDITQKLENNVSRHINAYNLMFKFPVCRIGEREYTAAPIYRSRYVLNPFLLDYHHFPTLRRWNGIVLRPKRLLNDKWWVEGSSNHADMDAYRAAATLVSPGIIPGYYDRLAEAVDDDELSLDKWRRQ